MSLDVLALAVQAAIAADWPVDEELGVGLADVDVDLELDVRWVMYRSEGAGVILGVRSARWVGSVVEALTL